MTNTGCRRIGSAVIDSLSRERRNALEDWKLVVMAAMVAMVAMVAAAFVPWLCRVSQPSTSSTAEMKTVANGPTPSMDVFRQVGMIAGLPKAVVV